MKLAKPRFLVTVEADHKDDDPGGFRRLRSFLKRLLRGHGLRCKGVRPDKAKRTKSDSRKKGA